MIALRDRIFTIARAPYFRRFWLYRLIYAIALHFDAMIDWAVMALKARYPEWCATDLPDALPILGRERGIRRGFSETAQAYAQRLVLWLVSRRIKGSPYALMDQLAGYLTGHAVRIHVCNNAGTWYTRDVDGLRSWRRATPTNWNWDNEPANGRWSRYWVIIHVPDTLWAPKGKMGSTGAKVGARGKAVGLSCDAEQGRTLRAIVREWNPPHARCEWIILSFDPVNFEPNLAPLYSGMPDGTWTKWGIEKAGHYVPARVDTGRYAAGRQLS